MYLSLNPKPQVIQTSSSQTFQSHSDILSFKYFCLWAPCCHSYQSSTCCEVGSPSRISSFLWFFSHKFVWGFLLLISKLSVMPHISALCWVGLLFNIFQRKTPPAINSAEENNPTDQIASFPCFECFFILTGKKTSQNSCFPAFIFKAVVLHL